MGWAVGYDLQWKRDVGYGVPAICDQPDCSERIDRGLSFVCGGLPFGGEKGCGLYFCFGHLGYQNYGSLQDAFQLCERCLASLDPFEPKPDILEWIEHKLSDPSWSQWRIEHRAETEVLREGLRKAVRA